MGKHGCDSIFMIAMISKKNQGNRIMKHTVQAKQVVQVKHSCQI